MPRQAASANESASGLGSTLRSGTTTFSAIVPWCFSLSSVRLGSSVSSPTQPGEGTTPWMTTSLPSSVVPAPSQPRIIGNCSSLIPTPRSVNTSCMFRLAAFTSTVTQPSPASGSGRSPTSRADSGSSALGAEA